MDSYVRSQDTAEEIVQDLFLAVWIKRHALENTKSIAAYLFAAARNRALQHLRHRAVVERRIEQLSYELPTESPADQQLERDEVTQAVRAAIDELPPRTRLAIVLRVDHEMSVAEVAEAMGVSLKGAEKLLATAKAKLRLGLGPRSPNPAPADAGTRRSPR